MIDKKTMGKRSRAAGQRFERKVREDLEKEGWIVAKWTNNIEFMCTHKEHCCARLVKVKNKFLGPGRPMMLGAGFPDFICFKQKYEIKTREFLYEVIGVESKMTGILDKEEKEKCKWLLDNRVFSKILIAGKGTKRGQIVYTDFLDKYPKV